MSTMSHEQLGYAVHACLDAVSSYIWLMSKPNSTLTGGMQANNPMEQWLIEKCCDAKLYLQEIAKELDPYEDDLH